jgi:hypothetical protein
MRMMVTITSFGENINLDNMEYLSIELEPKTHYTYFVHKFKNLPVALPILHEEKVKDELFDSNGILLIHCETTEPEEYMFTICVEYAKAAFYLPKFLKSLENSKYKSLLKEIETQVDRKKRINKDGLPPGLKAIALRIRQLLVSFAIMATFNWHIIEQMRSTDLTRHIMSQGRRMGFALLAFQGKASTP